MPPISKIGIKTATSETLMESTVNPISRAPRNAACTGVIPCSMKRVTFSSTQSHRPPRSRWRSPAPSATGYPDCSRAGNHSESADQRQGHRDGRNQGCAANVRRKAKTTRMTSMTEMISVNSISDTRLDRDWCGRNNTQLMAGEIDACNCGSAALTYPRLRYVRARWRETIISTPGLPLASPRCEYLRLRPAHRHIGEANGAPFCRQHQFAILIGPENLVGCREYSTHSPRR